MLKQILIFQFLVLMSFLLVDLAGATAADSTNISTARQEFLDAERSLQIGDMKTFHNLKKKLQEYPLLPYLNYLEIQKKFATLSTNDIRAALNELSDTPLQRQLVDIWLNRLAAQKRWKTYLEFSTPQGTITQQCRRLHAFIKTGQQQQAFDAVPTIWLHGHSRPKSCDTVFNAWIDSGHLTEELVWQRLELAMQAGQIRLARYLKRFLSKPDDQNWVERWIKLHQKPSNPAHLLKEDHPYREVIIVHSIKRLARKDVNIAFDAWQSLHVDPAFTDQQHLSVARTFASYLIHETNQGLIQRLPSLVPTHLHLDPHFTDKRFQAALRRNDWNQVLKSIENLSAEEQAKERWCYWRARALDQLGRRSEAEQLLLSLADQRSYYGFLAANHLGKKPNILHQTLAVDQNQMKRLTSLPGLLRARELHALDRTLQARREWNLAIKNMSTEELKGAAKLAQEWNWPSQTILTLSKIRYWNDLVMRFPLNHRQQVDQQAKDHGLESAWIYAILRQESAFIADARSPAGALGLMQLMPTTAKQIATQKKIKPFKTNDLFQPTINIKLGTSYLNQVYRQLQENPVLATAAYNAGPNRVKNWLPQEPQATDVWIETVPFRETREYLKRVLAYTLIYNHRLGNTPEQLPDTWIKPIQASHHYDDTVAKSQAGA